VEIKGGRLGGLGGEKVPCLNGVIFEHPNVANTRQKIKCRENKPKNGLLIYPQLNNPNQRTIHKIDEIFGTEDFTNFIHSRN
jgi:hypothetical protein